MHLSRAGKAHLDILFFLLADIFQDNDPHKIEIPRWLASACCYLCGRCGSCALLPAVSDAAGWTAVMNILQTF